MKILVPVKQVIDPQAAIQLKPDGSGIDAAAARMILNPYDETALECALRLKEVGVASEIIAVSCGGKNSVDALRAAVAMGVSHVLHLETENAISPLTLSRMLKAVAEKEACSLILIGRLGMGNDSNQVAPMLAAMLHWTLIPFAEKMEIREGKLMMTTVTDEGNEILATHLPAVISVEVAMMTPRVPKITQLLQAKKAPIRAIPVSDLGVDLEPKAVITQLRAAPTRSRGEQVFDAETLVARLRTRPPLS